MDNCYQKIAEKYIRHWHTSTELDERLQTFLNEFENWMMQLSDEVKPIVLVLLDNFNYYSHYDANRWLVNLHNNLVESHTISEDDTIYTYIKSKDGKSNSSNDYWTEYKLINKINRNLCYENSNKISEEQWKFISNIVFIDDCCGTGNSFIRGIEVNQDRYVGKNIYFVTIHVMEEALMNIQEFCNKSYLNIKIISATVQKKAFSKEYFFDEVEDAKRKIYDASLEFGLPIDQILGYQNSESLMAFYNNTPNNTLGLIRYDTDKYKSLFPRVNDEKPSWQKLNRKKKNRKASNYNAALRGKRNE